MFTFTYGRFHKSEFLKHSSVHSIHGIHGSCAKLVLLVTRHRVAASLPRTALVHKQQTSSFPTVGPGPPRIGQGNEQIDLKPPPPPASSTAGYPCFEQLQHATRRNEQLVPRPDSPNFFTASAMEPPAKKLCADFQRKQCLCDLGTGEVVHICHFKAAGPAQVEGFEFQVQSLARQLYSLTIGITDVRVCHPKVGEVVFVLTFISRRECDKFCAGPGQQLFKILGPHIADQNPVRLLPRLLAKTLAARRVGLAADEGLCLRPFLPRAGRRQAFSCVGTLMPKAHTLESLLGYLKKEVTGRSHYEHDINAIQTEMGKWFPR